MLAHMRGLERSIASARDSCSRQRPRKRDRVVGEVYYLGLLKASGLVLRACAGCTCTRAHQLKHATEAKHDLQHGTPELKHATAQTKHYYFRAPSASLSVRAVRYARAAPSLLLLPHSRPQPLPPRGTKRECFPLPLEPLSALPASSVSFSSRLGWEVDLCLSLHLKKKGIYRRLSCRPPPQSVTPPPQLLVRRPLSVERAAFF
jgi:hypothetical protein